ncbi:MAG: nuclear transport factor 2 family protein [Rhodoglobus sp.]
MTSPDEAAVLAAADRIVDDFANHRPAEYFAGFDAGATFVFYTADKRLESRAEYEALWAGWERDNGFAVRGCVSANRRVRFLGKDVALFLHDVTSTISLDGETSVVHEQETIVFERRGAGWIAVHEHLSPASAGGA